MLLGHTLLVVQLQLKKVLKMLLTLLKQLVLVYKLLQFQVLLAIQEK